MKLPVIGLRLRRNSRAFRSHGIGQTFSFMAQPHIKRGSLVSLFGNWRRPSQAIQLVYPANRHLSAKLTVFVDWAVERFAGQLS